jgi:hypothetical protein
MLGCETNRSNWRPSLPENASLRVSNSQSGNGQGSFFQLVGEMIDSTAGMTLICQFQSDLSALFQQQGCSFGICRFQWCPHDAWFLTA